MGSGRSDRKGSISVSQFCFFLSFTVLLIHFVDTTFGAHSSRINSLTSSLKASNGELDTFMEEDEHSFISVSNTKSARSEFSYLTHAHSENRNKWTFTQKEIIEKVNNNFDISVIVATSQQSLNGIGKSQVFTSLQKSAAELNQKLKQSSSNCVNIFLQCLHCDVKSLSEISERITWKYGKVSTNITPILQLDLDETILGEIVLFATEKTKVPDMYLSWLKASYQLYGSRLETSGFSYVSSDHDDKSGSGLFMRKRASFELFAPTKNHWTKFTKWVNSGSCTPGLCHDILRQSTKPGDFELIVDGPISLTDQHHRKILEKLHGFYCRVKTHMDQYVIYPGVSNESVRKNTDFKLPLAPNVLGSHSKSTSSTVAIARGISESYGLINMQLLNAGYLELTKNFICNCVQLLDRDPHLFSRTLFIATDIKTFTELETFKKTMNLDYSVALEHFEDENKLNYGSTHYFDYMAWRSGFIQMLLQNGINLFLTEADAFWLDSPFLDENIMDPVYDLVLCHNGMEGSTYPNGGFMFLKAREVVVAAWTEMFDLQVLAAKENGKRNEQAYEREIFMKYKAEKGLNWFWIDSKQVSSGYWYKSSHKNLRASENTVILNNWIKGVDKKVTRAKKYGQWFLDKDQSQCLA